MPKTLMVVTKHMEGYTPWISYDLHDPVLDDGVGEFDEIEEVTDEKKKIVSLDSVLPDELLERILFYLPIASIFRAGCVCKKWHEIVTSKRFCSMLAHVSTQQPWYFMFTGTDGPYGYVYDPTLRKWHGISLPCFVTSSWFVASSSGLVCFMNNDNRSELHVYNPLTKCSKNLMEPPGLKHSDYSALAISVDSASRGYAVVVVKSNQVPENFHQWDLSIHVYDSETMMWVTSATEILNGWRGGYASAISNGVLYFLIYATVGAAPDSRHGLIRYNLSHRSSSNVLMRNFIPIPCSLTCGRLMNLKEKLVMVGGIGKQDRSDIIKGIGIWVLDGTQWQEIARMPQKFFQGFGEFDDVFASSGTDDMIYIQSYGAPALLVFDMTRKQWKWTQKCPVVKKFPLQVFNGFCFEPRLDTDP
ncbi:F-box/kelch-repeat protein-like protein [Drosera capensis]